MTWLGQFAVYNLAASMLAGLAAWGVVMVVLRLLRARAAFLYASFLALPLVKSVLVLIGLGLILPVRALSDWQQRALPPQAVVPFILLWTAAAVVVYRWLVARARSDILRHAARPGPVEAQRLMTALDRLLQAYEQSGCCEAGETVCCISDQVPHSPRMLVSDRLRSPAALVEGGVPVIIFPSGLIRALNNDELALALAHELNHFALRRPGGWSAGNLRVLSLVSPVALLLADSLRREEEKACDDLAVRMLGMPDVYAGMLLKSYQFARSRHALASFPFLPQLLGDKPLISERVERLMDPPAAKARWFQSRLVLWPAWGLLIYLLFFARFGA